MAAVDLTDLSRSYPFLHLSRKFGVDYGEVLRIADHVDKSVKWVGPGGIKYEVYTLIPDLPDEVVRLIITICLAPWRWQFPPQGRGLYSENECPGHVASQIDPRICGRCGVHVGDLRPEDEQW